MIPRAMTSMKERDTHHPPECGQTSTISMSACWATSGAGICTSVAIAELAPPTWTPSLADAALNQSRMGVATSVEPGTWPSFGVDDAFLGPICALTPEARASRSSAI